MQSRLASNQVCECFLERSPVWHCQTCNLGFRCVDSSTASISAMVMTQLCNVTFAEQHQAPLFQPLDS